MQKKKLWIGAVAVLLVITAVITGLALHKAQLEDARNEALLELERDAGQYDEQSIVLYETSKAKAEELAELYGAQLRITENGRFATLTLPEGTTIRDVYAMEETLRYIDDMAADYQVKVSDLEEAEEDGERLPMRPEYPISDEDYELQTYLDYLNMGNVWGSCRGDGVTIAVIDTGIDTDHPEFAGRISEYSYNATEDKIVKDYNDWSLIEDEQGHGTAVTGVAAASMNSGNIVGIAPNVNILVIKAECDENGNFYRTSDLIFGIYYAIERDVQIINMSFGAQSPANPFAEAIQLAYDSDIICVAAAGNCATASLTWPAADEHVIGVGALGDGWSLANYSNFGENTDLVAPGTAYTTQMGGSYGSTSGTSLSCPMVAGAVAMFIQGHHYATFEEVTENLYAACYDLGDLGRDWYYGFGALDINALIWEPKGTITYDMLTDELENLEGIYVQGHTLQQMPEPERLYAVFDGWYYDDTFTQEYNYYEDRFYGAEITLYAKWANEEDGVPYTYVILDDGTVEIRSYTGHRKFITIPEKIEGRVVSSIGDFAFDGQNSLREVNLPSGLTHIGLGAFQNCANLLNIQIPDNVTEIEDSAFAGNVRLSYVAISGNSKLQSIGDFVFQGCGKLERFELPATVTKVSGATFYGATGLHTITVQAGNTAFVSKDGVLFNHSGSTLVAFPAAHGTSYTLPADVKQIGFFAFAFGNITQIDLGNVQTIGDSGFAYSALQSIVIADSVTDMGIRAFQGCTALNQVSIGSGLTELPESGFAGTTSLRTVTIPKSIVHLGTGVFANGGLQEIVFEENSTLETIGSSAFYECNLTEIDIPASVHTIGSDAFSGFQLGNPLIRVGFAENSVLHTIGGSAFAKCWLLKEIQLPAGLQTIGEFAFQLSGLTEVTVPAAVTSLGAGAFSRCSALTAVTVEEGNAIYHDVDGVVYTLDDQTLHTYPAGKVLGDYAPQNTTEIIAPWAFAGAKILYMVTLPESLTQISEYAFAYCEELQNLHIPDNVLQIGRYAFAYDWNLRNVMFTVASKLPRISYGAFAYCGITNLYIPASVSTIAQEAFTGCESLWTVTFMKNSQLESISAYMFDGCTNLGSITFEQGSALKSIQAHGLEGMQSLTSIDFGDAQLTNIDNFAFRFCESLTSLQLPETLTNIGRYAFYGCKSLAELNIPSNVEHIGSYAFLGTRDLNLYFASETLPAYLDENWDHATKGYYTGVSSVQEANGYKYAVLTSGNIAILEYLGEETHVDLAALDLGADITIIGGSAFEGSTVQTIVLPDTLTAIQAEAFAYSNLTNITIPANVTFIGREAFAYTDLENLTFAAASKLAVMEQYAFEGTKSLKAITLPASLTTMGTGAFLQSGLETVTFENGIQITEIPQKAFANTKLASVTLPDSVTLVNHNAFNGVETLKSVTFGNNEGIRLMSNAFYNTGLTSLHIPANVTYIGEYCFVALSDLTEITVDENNPNYKAVDGLLLTKDGRKLITVPAGRTGSLTVPEGVEEIGFGAFEESKLSEINFLPDANILTFGYRAFFKAENIISITIPKSVVSIDYYAFAYCENLRQVIFAEDNKLTGIYEGAFLGCINLETITIPDSIVEISDFAFYGCSKITKLPISENNQIKGIYDYAFAYTGLKGDFTTPETLYDIGSYAFLGTKVEKVTIPETNKKDLIIGIGAFEDCNQLTEITLPFIGASFEDEEISWFGYIFGAGGYYANNSYIPESLENVTVTEGTTTLYPHAFFDVDTPEWLHLPKSITVLYEACFQNAGSRFQLQSPVVLKHTEGDQFVGQQFAYSNVCGTVALAEGTKVILPFTFDHALLLRSVMIPDSVTTISFCAFQGCGITSITIPASVTTIEDSAFGCFELRSITNYSALNIVPGESTCGGIAEYAVLVTDRNGNTITLEDGVTRLETEDGFLFEIRDGAYELVAYTGTENTVRLPEQINGQTYTIYRMKGVDRVIVPGALKTLSAGAFNDTDITSVVLEEGITHIGDGAFADCLYLESVELPQSLESIGNNAFNNCRELTQLQLGSNVSQIGNNAFLRCEKLRLSFSPDNTNFAELDGVVYDVAKTQVVYVGDDVTSVVLPKTVVSFSFDQRENLRSVVFEEGSSLHTIPSDAFRGCTALESLVLPDSVTYIDSSAFSGCTSLKAVTLPANLRRIGTSVFEGCAALETIVLPDSVEMLEYGAFRGCVKLKKINIPASLTNLNGNPFLGSGIEELIFPDGFTAFKLVDGALYDPEMTTLYAVLNSVEDLVIPNSVIDFAWGAFEECGNLQNVHFGEGTTVIPGGAFSRLALHCVTLPSSLQLINYWAMPNVCVIYNNSDLDLTFGSEDHGAIAWQAMCIVDKDGNATYNLPEGSIVTEDGFAFSYESGRYYLVAYLGSQSTVTLPLTVNGQTYAIREMVGVRNLIIPEGFTEISDDAFYNCSTLKSVVIPNTVTRIGVRAFGNCHGLTSVVIPDSVKSIGNMAFGQCYNLAEIRIPDNVDVEGGVFSETAYLKDPKNWTDGACYLNKVLLAIDKELTSFTVREDTVDVDYNAFNQAFLLEYLDLGTISEAHLMSCTNLKTLVLGATPRYGFLRDFFGYYEGVPLTLTNIVVSSDVIRSANVLADIAGCVIFVDAYEADVRWDDNFPGWNNGNVVVYGDRWSWVNFYDAEGNLLVREPKRNAEVIRRPVYQLPEATEAYRYEFLGWDLDGDGAVDSVPATTVVDIHAVAVLASIHTHIYETAVTEPTCQTGGYTTYTCPHCGDSYVADATAATGICKDENGDSVCDWCGATLYIPGDVDGDGGVDSDDAIYLLYYTFNAENYPLNQDGDFDGDGNVDSDDAIYLLYYTFNPTDYPLH